MIEYLIIFAIVIIALYLAIKFLLPIIKIVVVVAIAAAIAFCIYRPEIVKSYIQSLKERYEENKNDLTITKTHYNMPTRLENLKTEED
ncbi:MAG: hypothetical protein ACOC5T_04975 [Elusimicrobiota bacterium]